MSRPGEETYGTGRLILAGAFICLSMLVLVARLY